MSIQRVSQTLKTVKKNCNVRNTTTPQSPHRKIADTVTSTAQTTIKTPPAAVATILSTLTPNIVKFILSDPQIKTPKCLSFFNFILKNQSLIPFKINIDLYVTLICRAINSRKFEDAENLLSLLSNDGIQRYPFSDIASSLKNQRCHSRISSKVLNLMLKAYSDNRKFSEAYETFNYMRNNRITIDERTCCVHLIALMRCDHLGLGLEFFYKMVEYGIDVSVYSLTVLVDGLCKNGEIRTARELVEEMVFKNVKPNVITFNTLVDACGKRWNFEELDLILLLMEKEEIEPNLETYKLLIDGYLSGGKTEEAERMIMEMREKDLKVETFLFNSIIMKYCRLGRTKNAFKVFDKMTERGVAPNAETYRIMVSGICGVGEIESAKELVYAMERREIDLGSNLYNDLIDGCCKKQKFDDALGFICAMERKGFFADVRLYKMVICGLCELDRVKEASRLLSIVVKSGATLEKETAKFCDY